MNSSSEIEAGTVYWVTGLSGAGETLFERWSRARAIEIDAAAKQVTALK